MKKKEIKKIAIITEYLSHTGGIEKSILLLCNELEKRNIEYDIFSGIFSPEDTFDEFKNLNVKRFRGKKFPPVLNSLYLRMRFFMAKWDNYDGFLIFGHHSIGAAKNNHPNLWWSTGPLQYIYGIGSESPGSILYRSTRNPLSRGIGFLYVKLLEFLDQRQVKSLDTITAVGPRAKRRLRDAYNINVEIVPSPVHTQDYKFNQIGDYFLSVSRLTKHANLDRLIKAFKEMPDKKLYIAGSGPEEEPLRELARECENIKILGFVKDNRLKKLYSNCRAVISLYNKDIDFSMNLIESICSGKPIIWLRELKDKKLLEKKIGFYIGNLEKETIKEAVKELNRKKALEKKKHCLNEAKNFSAENFTNGLLKRLK